MLVPADTSFPLEQSRSSRDSGHLWWHIGCYRRRAPMLALLLAAALSSCPAESRPMADLSLAVAEAARIELRPDACVRGGRKLAPGEIATPGEIALDAYCGDLIAARSAPNGYLTVFGSARVKEGDPGYESARAFAKGWTRRRPEIPIAAGAGGGYMEAANRGAKEAGGVSIGFGTHFPKAGVDKLNPWVTDGYMFTDFSMRERALFRRARGFVIYPGGFGTAWELFQALSEIQTGKKSPVPVILVGRLDQWDHFLDAIGEMRSEGSIGPQDHLLVKVVPDADSAVETLAQQIR
jgi:predicted Rossmann-fold nucleotide-binding protein